MKKAIIKFTKIFIPPMIATIVFGYFYFIKIPSDRIEFLAKKFEIAVRNNDKNTINKTISPTRTFWKRLDDKEMFQKLQELFEKFHQGIEIYRVYPNPFFLLMTRKRQFLHWAE